MEEQIDIVIESRTRELAGDFKVRRVLPSARRRMVGPFIFFDEMGPEIIGAGKALDVAPHPHIGLATVTYLFSGEILHRDSLGSVQPILPGAVNWMTAGSGIAHSERTPPELRGGKKTRLFGIQSWVALPESLEETEPGFAHHPAAELPLIDDEGKNVRVIAGSLYGETSPVKTLSDLFYADVLLEEDAELPVPSEHEERAVYIVGGEVRFRSDPAVFGAGQLVVFRPGAEIVVSAAGGPARLLLLGGEPLGKRHIWWNFVSSSRDRIEQAKEDWRGNRFAPVPGDDERIPLPDEPKPPAVSYP